MRRTKKLSHRTKNFRNGKVFAKVFNEPENKTKLNEAGLIGFYTWSVVEQLMKIYGDTDKDFIIRQYNNLTKIPYGEYE